MHLKRLELLGFKSFASKTALDFPGGIAAIVGPNGAGKSNVIDAVRWILGEREVKNLRGAKAEDLIFAGTPKKSRMGMAQVSLTFDNSSGFFPVDYSEVTIVRRIDRDGVSQYFLNKSEVRLKDIVDFFAKVRLGTKGLVIINQGESDLFVRAMPRERRIMVEEILGLRQYQLKKHEANKKLENTIINLDKVKAIVDEIAPHLRFLKKQTAKWEKLSEIQNSLKETEDAYFKNKLKEINEGLVKFEPRIAEIDEEAGKKQKELKNLQAVLEEVENKQSQNQDQKLGDIQKKREELLNRRSALEKELGRLEARLEFISVSAVDENTGKNAAVLIEETKNVLQKAVESADFKAVKDSLKNLLNKIEEFLEPQGGKKNPEFIEVQKSKDEITKQLEAIIAEIKQLGELESSSTSNLEKFNAEFRKAFEDVEAKKDEISVLESEKNKFLLDTERFRFRMQDLELQISQAGRNILEFKGKETSPVDDMVVLEKKMLRLRAEVMSVGEVDQALINEAKETESRHSFLSRQSDDLKKAAADLKNLIKELDIKIHNDFTASLKKINEEFHKFFELMFGGGKAKMVLEKLEKTEVSEAESGGEFKEKTEEFEEDEKLEAGIDIELSLPRKKIKSLDMLSGGEKSLVSIAALFALISVSPPPFLVLDEIDAALDEKNTRRFAEIIKNFSKKTQFIIVTHNRATMESANVLYGVTMEDDGVSKVLSLKLES